MDKLVSFCKSRGFVFPGSEIYGGLANSWDYGPLGFELKKNIKDAWWKRFVQQRLDMVGIDAALLMNPKVWEASGHVATFTDPLVECKECHERYRTDHLIDGSRCNEVALHVLNILEREKKISNEGLQVVKENIETLEELDLSLHKNSFEALLKDVNAQLKKVDASQVKREYLIKILEDLPRYQGLVIEIVLSETKCPNCKSVNWSEPAAFNLMLRTWLGPKQDASSTVYFRPETAQAMFVDFQNVLTASRKRVPFGIAQIGKAFRNEITPGNFIFRQREFEQMEIEYFIHPSTWETQFEFWLAEMHAWVEECGIHSSAVHDLEVPADELAHYSKRTVDLEYDFPFGRKELYGIAYRTDFDLKNHGEASGEDMRYTDPITNEKYIPHVIEPTFGVDRTFLAVLVSAYDEEEVGEGEEKDTRIVLRLKPHLAPIKIAILPLSKKENLSSVARDIAQVLAKHFRVDYDETQSIGKRYRRQDEIGTPFCVTVDFDTLGEGDAALKDTVTVRERDSMKQERVAVADLDAYFSERLRR